MLSRGLFLDETQTKVLRVFILAIHSHLYSLPWDCYFFKLTQPRTVSTVQLLNTVKKPQVWELSRFCPETSTKLYVHEFGFRKTLLLFHWILFLQNLPRSSRVLCQLIWSFWRVLLCDFPVEPEAPLLQRSVLEAPLLHRSLLECPSFRGQNKRLASSEAGVGGSSPVVVIIRVYTLHRSVLVAPLLQRSVLEAPLLQRSLLEWPLLHYPQKILK